MSTTICAFQGDSVSGRALLTIDVLRDGWTRVQIPAGLMVRDARLDGQPVSLVEGPPPHVLLSRAGRSVLTLEIVIPLTSSAGTDSIALPASPSPISRAALVLPTTGVDLALNGGFVSEHAETATESRWTAFGRPDQPLTLSWKRKVDDRRAELPLPTVGDWEASGGHLRVRLLEPVATEISFIVQAETRAPRDGPIAVPLVRMPSAERETGGVAVDVVGAGEIGGRQVRGLEPADPSELGDIVANRESPSMIAFRLRPLAGSEPRALTVNVVGYAPQAVLIANVEEARYRVLASEDGRLLVEARYAVRNNQRSFLKVTLPSGATVWSAEVAGRPIRPGVADQDAVLLPLEKGRAGENAPTFVVELVYLQRVDSWLDKGKARIDLPSLDLPVSRTGLALHYSPRFRIEPQAGVMRVESDPGPFAEALRGGIVVNAKSVKAKDDGAAAGLQALVDRFRNESGGRTVIGVLPVHVAFPTFGPSISLTEYNRLIDLASRPPQGPAIAPVASVLASADLRVRVERETARGLFNLTGDVLRAGFSRVNLMAGATLVDANVGGRPLPLMSDGNAHSALLPGPGPFSLALEWGAPLKFTPGRASFVLPVPPSGTARATIDLPGDQADVHLSAGLVTRRSTVNGRTIVEATLDPGSSTEVWWSMRDSAPVAAAREVRTLADVLTLMTLGDSDVRMAVLIDLTVVALQSLARLPILSAFRYQRSATAAGLALEVKRFNDTGVLAAIAERAVATTLVTAEGRALTEIALTVQNRAQSFLKVSLPPGATIVSVEVAGEAAKPVLGADGTRVPLLRPGFRPSGSYQVTFVYLHAETPFAKKGEMQMTLPRMDLPVGIVEWEVFVPDTYSVRAFDGNVIDRRSVDVGFVSTSGMASGVGSGIGPGTAGGVSGGVTAGVFRSAVAAAMGEIRGRATDSTGSVLPGVTIVLEAAGSRKSAITGTDGTFAFSGVPSGSATITAQLAGFVSERSTFAFDQQPQDVHVAMRVGALVESVTVTAESPNERVNRSQDALKMAEPSQNVINLQRRTAGVLPVRVDVPRAGTSHQFVKPLVVDQETMVRFKYKRR